MKGKFYRLFAIMATVLLFAASAYAQTKDAKDLETESKLRSQLPQLLGSNNAGTVFYMTFHPCWETAAQQNFIRVYVSSAVETTVTLEIPALGIVKQQKTVPNDVIQFILYPTEAQMYSKPGASAIKPLPSQVWQGRAVKVSADYPIICYGVTRFQYTSDGYLALPVSSLGKTYTVSSYADPTDNTGQYLPSYTSIVGIYDATKVDFTIGGNESMAITLEDGVSEAKAGERVTRVLNDGDVWLIAGKYAYNDLSGSFVRANKPVNVISGNFCAYIPTEVSACDFISEQELPQNTWGYKYHVTKIAGRKNNSVIKIFPKEVDTDLYKDNQMFGTITQLNGFRASGWIERRADDGAPRPVVYSSTKPIYVVQYNPGQSDDGVPSDPFQMVLTPLEQYQKEIVWNTPGIKGGYGFAINYINIVYKATIDGGIPADLEFATVQGGNFHWTPLVDMDGFPGDKFNDMDSADGRFWYSKIYKIPQDGVYKLRANDPMANYAYGFGDYDSYGFPTSVATADLEVPDSLPPVFFFNQECNGDVVNYNDPSYNKDPYWGGVVHDEPEIDPENMSKLALFYVEGDDSYNFKFEAQPFQVGIDYKTLFRATIVDRSLDARLHLVATDRRGNRSDTVIEYVSSVLKIDPYKWDAGLSKPGGPTLRKTFTVTNNTPSRSIAPTGLILQTVKDLKPSQGFNLIVKPADLTTPLAPGQSMKFTIEFTPTVVGSFKDSVGVGDSCFFYYQSLVKASVGEPKIYADDHDFGKQVVGKRTQGVSLAVANRTSDGATTDLKVSKILYDTNMVGDVGSGKPFEILLQDGFKLDQVDDNNIITVPNGGTKQFTVTFKAGAVQDYATVITWVADADQPKDSTILQGSGIMPSLDVTGDDWQRRRSDINSYKKDPQGTYPFNAYASPNAAIKLTNSGSDVVTLSNPEITNDVNGDDYEVFINNAWQPLNSPATLNIIFNGMRIAANSDTTVPVFFHPRSISGTHSLSIAFNSDASEKPVSDLNGIAIWPKVGSQGLTFDYHVIGTPAEKGVVKFWNENWDYSDKVTITDFKAVGGNNSTINSNKSTNPTFFYDLTNITDQNGNKLSLPNITIQPGDTISIPCEFNPAAAGLGYSATLTTVSDAELETTATLNGDAYEEGTSMTDASVVTCTNLKKVLTPSITNTGTVPVEVISAVVEPVGGTGVNLSDFNVLDKSFKLGDKNSATKTHTIRVEFTPTVQYNNVQVRLVVKFLNANGELKTITGDTCTLTVTATHEDFVTHGMVKTPSKPNYTTETAEVAIGAQGGVTYGIFLDATSQPDFQSLLYNISISYRKDFIGVGNNGNDLAINVGKDFAALGYSIQGKPTRSIGTGNIETINVQLAGNQPITQAMNNMEVLTVSFNAYMPWYTDAQGTVQQYKDETPAIISHTMDAGDVCVSYLPSQASVKLDPTCFNGGRQVILTGTNFGLSEIAPNPVSSLGANIDFSVGWDNAYTEIKIYNANMQEIATPIAEVMQQGAYKVQLPIDKMPSGAYFIRMKSAYYTSPLVKCIVTK